MNLIDLIIQKTDVATTTFVFDVYSALVANFQTEIRLMLVVYVALYGIALLRGVIDHTVRDALWRIVGVTIAYHLATDWGLYGDLVHKTLTNGPNEIVAALINAVSPFSSINSAYTAFGDLFDRCIDVTAAMVRKGGFGEDIVWYFWALMYFVVASVMVCVAVFFIVLAKLALAVLLPLAPIFIMLFIYPVTRTLCAGWFRMLIQYALIPVIVVAMLLFVVGIIEDDIRAAAAGTTSLNVKTVGYQIVLMALSAALFTQALGMAASITGGLTLAAGQVYAAIKQPLGQAGGLVQQSYRRYRQPRGVQH